MPGTVIQLIENDIGRIKINIESCERNIERCHVLAAQTRSDLDRTDALRTAADFESIKRDLEHKLAEHEALRAEFESLRSAALPR